MSRSFLPCGAYALALAAMIFSHTVTNAPIGLFVVNPGALNADGADWLNWHGVGCLFAGLTNVAAHRWTEARARRDVAAATALLFGGWAAQNFLLMFTPRFTPLMWANVAGCALAAVASAMTARALHAEASGARG